MSMMGKAQLDIETNYKCLSNHTSGATVAWPWAGIRHDWVGLWCTEAGLKRTGNERNKQRSKRRTITLDSREDRRKNCKGKWARVRKKLCHVSMNVTGHSVKWSLAWSNRGRFRFLFLLILLYFFSLCIWQF